MHMHTGVCALEWIRPHACFFTIEKNAPKLYANSLFILQVAWEPSVGCVCCVKSHQKWVRVVAFPCVVLELCLQ